MSVTTDDLDSIVRNVGGRPKGSTLTEKATRQRKIQTATYEATRRYTEEKYQGDGNLPHGTLDRIIRSAVCSQGLLSPDAKSIKKETIRLREKSGSLFGVERSNRSPMQHVEVILIQFCLAMNRMTMSIDSRTFLHLAMDLVMGTNVETQMIHWKKCIDALL